MSKDNTKTFSGTDVDVVWDKRLCIHVAECGQADNDLFDGKRKPWCIPDTTAADEVAEVCERCPSGALSYKNKTGGANETAAEENTVAVLYDGPLYLRGELSIDGKADDMHGVDYRAALCRCGRSNNKPFCDNSHRKCGFHDAGAIGEKGPGVDAAGGTLDVKPIKDGPLVVTGNLTLIAGSGRRAWHGDNIALCRCGHSANKPFCDGTHSKVGFKSE
jgi:CDGSH-type Zn-finger protein/uncharacterized Fe-S cluster protein YjdI